MSRPTLVNFALSLAVALLVAVSPFTPNEWLPSFGLGGLVGLCFFVYRERFVEKSPDTRWDGRRVVEAFRFRDINPNLWFSLIGFALVFAPTMLWMYFRWTSSVWQNNHGIFMPVLMVLVGRAVLRREDSIEDDTSAWGYLLLAVGLSLAVVDSGIHTHYVAAVGLVVCLPGLSLLILGHRRTLALRVVWLLGLFMIPIPTTLSNHLFLRNATAAGTVPLLRMLGIPANQEHSVLDLADGVFVVSDACSGFATLYSAMALTMFLICYCPSNLRRVALLLSFFPLALAANILRVLMLILMAIWGDASLLDTALHEASGVASFFVIIGGLFWMTDRHSLRGAFL